MMFSGFFGGIFALFCTAVIAVGGIIGLVKSVRATRQQADLEQIVSDFISTNAIAQCKPGFYNGKEKLLATQLDIEDNTAYKMLSVKQNALLGNVNRSQEKKHFREAMNHSSLLRKQQSRQ